MRVSLTCSKFGLTCSHYENVNLRTISQKFFLVLLVVIIIYIVREQEIGQCHFVPDVTALCEKPIHFSKDCSVRSSSFDCHILTDKLSAVPNCTVTEAGTGLFVFPLDVG